MNYKEILITWKWGAGILSNRKARLLYSKYLWLCWDWRRAHHAASIWPIAWILSLRCPSCQPGKPYKRDRTSLRSQDRNGASIQWIRDPDTALSKLWSGLNTASRRKPSSTCLSPTSFPCESYWEEGPIFWPNLKSRCPLWTVALAWCFLSLSHYQFLSLFSWSHPTRFQTGLQRSADAFRTVLSLLLV